MKLKIKVLTVVMTMACAFCLAFGLVGCKKNKKPESVAVTSVSLSESTLTLTEGEYKTVIATVSPDNATDKTVSWSVDKQEIATVENGKVTAVKEGTAVVTATAGDKSATCTVTVNPKASVNPEPSTVAVTSVTLSKTEISFMEGEYEMITATVSPDNATDKTVSWSVDKQEIATVENGKITAVKEGTAVVTATAGDKSATCTVTVIKVIEGTSSLTYEKSGNEAICTGGATSATNIVIANMYEGVPVTQIKEKAFFGRKNLNSVNVPGTIKFIGDSAFMNCSKLTDVTLCNGVVELEMWVFANCTSLKSIVIPDSVTTMGPSCFKWCSALEEIKLSENQTEIRSSTFEKCGALKRVVVPGKVTKIDTASFQMCTNLEEIVIPVSVTRILTLDAFHGDSKLTVTYLGTKEQWAEVNCGASFRGTNVTEITCSDGKTPAPEEPAKNN